jgi:murein DD-endopeptidase MepM/ murein hydrolase activator NlpD
MVQGNLIAFCLSLWYFGIAKMERKNIGKIYGQGKGLSRGVFFNLLMVFLFFGFSPPSPAIAKKIGVYHPVSKGVTLYRISVAYKISIAKLMAANKLASPSALKVGSKIFIPGAKTVLKVEPPVPLSPKEKIELEHSLETEEKPDPAELPSEAVHEKPPWVGKELDIIWPIQGKINSPYGPRGKKFHGGIDIAAPFYQEVKAAMDGEVILARNSRTGYGQVVVLRHDLGFTTIYGHMNVIIAKEGESVRQGQAIGGVGSTGKSTGPHLHFEVRHDGRHLDPLPLLPMTIEQLLEKAAKK